MPRPARFTDDDVLDAARAEVANGSGRPTMAHVAARLGGPVGSIYHRFSSRDELLVRLWLRSVRRYQAGVFELEAVEDAHVALVRMALHVPRYCRTHPDEAQALLLYRQEHLMPVAPASLRDEVAGLNDDLSALVRRMCRRRFGTCTSRRTSLIYAAIAIGPYGLVRPHLGQALPPLLDEQVEATADAILRLGDQA